MDVLLKGLSNDAKEECRSTHACFKDCLNVMVHKSGVYSPIAVKFSGFVLLINAYNLPPRNKHYKRLANFIYVHTYLLQGLSKCNGS